MCCSNYDYDYSTLIWKQTIGDIENDGNESKEDAADDEEDGHCSD